MVLGKACLLAWFGVLDGLLSDASYFLLVRLLLCIGLLIDVGHSLFSVSRGRGRVPNIPKTAYMLEYFLQLRIPYMSL